MKEMLGMEKNKKILTIVIISSIIIALLGIYMLFFNNPRQVFMGIVNKINDKGLEIIYKNMETINLYDKDFTANNDLEYYIEIEKEREDKIVTVDKKTKKESVETKIVPYTQVLSNQINAYINKSKKNSHDIIRLTLPNTEENTVYNVYYQNGTMILDAQQYEQFIKLNNEVLKFGNARPSTINKLMTLYERTYKQLQKQFKDSDFYKISIKENTEQGTQTVNKYGLSVTEEKLNAIFVNLLQSLSKDQEFINAYISYKKDVDINSTIDKSVVRELINTKIEEIKSTPIKENMMYEVVIFTKGIFNQSIEKIEILEIEKDVILKSANISINNNLIEIEVKENTNTTININVKILDTGVELSINNKKINVNVTMNDFISSKEIIVSGYIDNNKLIGKYNMKKNSNNSQITNDLSISLNNGHKDIVYINLKNKTDFETVVEYVNSKRLYSIDQLDDQVKEYVDKFNEDIVDKLRI